MCNGGRSAAPGVVLPREELLLVLLQLLLLPPQLLQQLLLLVARPFRHPLLGLRLGLGLRLRHRLLLSTLLPHSGGSAPGRLRLRLRRLGLCLRLC